MSAKLQKGWKENLPYDLPAGVVVFLVALPLCLGIALASKAPLFSGIIAGVIGGVVISLFSGSQLSVSGPAAGLAVIVADSITTLGSFEGFILAVAISGIFQIALGLFRMGFIADYVPVSVIKGMLAGIGLIIFLKQIPHALGRDVDFQGDEAFFQTMDGENTFTEILKAIYSFSPGALLISVLSIAVLLFWETKFIKKQKWVLFVPGPLVVVFLGVIMNYIYSVAIPWWELRAEDQHMVSLPIASSPSEFAGFFATPDWSFLSNVAMWKVAAIIAIVGSLESLLSVEASDKLDPFHRISSTNKELQAQGIGNVISGLVGGLPITSVIVRSSANIYSGARTRQSAFLHGVLLAAAVIIIPGLLNLIPLASLAAILLLIGYKLASLPLFMKMWHAGKSQFIPFVTTVVVMVGTDLLTGVGVGMAVGIFYVIRTNHHNSVTVVNVDDYYLIRFNKDMSFVNKNELKKELRNLPENIKLIIDGNRPALIDADIVDILEDFKQSAPYRNITVEIRGVDGKSTIKKQRGN
jgi:MFS superfamily sulfate permease-like transporter